MMIVILEFKIINVNKQFTFVNGASTFVNISTFFYYNCGHLLPFFGIIYES